jgi:alkylresorcinol/alkylpyrone synthase
MAHISSVHTASPSYFYSTSEILEHTKGWLTEREQYALFHRFSESAHIGSRAFAVPIEKIFSLKGLEERSELFLTEGRKIGIEVVKTLLDFEDLRPSDIDALIFTSCSVPTIPSLEMAILQDLNFSPSTFRIPIYQYGCAGGAAGLSLAFALTPRFRRILLLSIELCSLVYHAKDFSHANLVGSALFGDGAGVALITQDPRSLMIKATQSYLIPNSDELMGYSLRDDGTHLKLHKDLPACLADVVPSLVHSFLEKENIPSVDWWLFHPGGAKILQSLERSFGLQRKQTSFAWDVLHDHGNMSSASVLFVLQRFLNGKEYGKGDNVLMVGIGPGMMVELLLLEIV